MILCLLFRDMLVVEEFSLANLAKSAQAGRPDEEKFLKSEDISGTEVGPVWSEHANNKSSESQAEMERIEGYMIKDGMATTETFLAMVETVGSNRGLEVVFNTGNGGTVKENPYQSPPLFRIGGLL